MFAFIHGSQLVNTKAAKGWKSDWKKNTDLSIHHVWVRRFVSIWSEAQQGYAWMLIHKLIMEAKMSVLIVAAAHLLLGFFAQTHSFLYINNIWRELLGNSCSVSKCWHDFSMAAVLGVNSVLVDVALIPFSLSPHGIHCFPISVIPWREKRCVFLRQSWGESTCGGTDWSLGDLQ